jgi:hypothetical protein
MKAREGDLIKDSNGTVFDVKGLVHPPDKIIAFPRFILEHRGGRKREGLTYGKIYNISERFRFLEKNFPNYVIHDSVFDEKLCEVPLESVKRHYDPDDGLKKLQHDKKLDALEKDALEFFAHLRNLAEIPVNKMGISGSLLVRLHTSNSDIDPIIYGYENCRKVYSTMQSALKEKDAPFKPYGYEDLERLFDFRSKDTKIAFRNFVRTEARKVLQGKFKERDYFIRFVKDWNEIDEKYGDVLYENVGYAKIKATIADASEAIFTPCTYTIEDARIIKGPKLPPIEEIASFRGRFCEQAREKEVVFAQGKVERVTDNRRDNVHFRLLLGNKPSDCMTLA